MIKKNILTQFFILNPFNSLLALHFLVFWIMSYWNLPLGHDTMLNFQTFKTIYSEMLLHGEFPYWFPYSTQGISADFAYIFTYTPAFYLVTFWGKLFSITDSIFLFRLGLYIEEILFLYGLYKLSRLCHQYILTSIIVSLTGWLSISWVIQIHWNFHLIYLYPLILYHTLQFLKGDALEHGAYVLLLMTLGGLFYTQIFISATLVILFILWIIIYRQFNYKWFCFGISLPKGIFVVCLSIFVAFINVQFALHVIDGMTSFTPQRLSDGSVLLNVFLSYGGYISSNKFMEFIYAAPVCSGFIAYSGLFTICFLLLGAIKSRQPLFYIFVILAIFILLFSIGKNGKIAEFLFYYFPSMDKFRHIGYVTPVAKILMIIASGFGIDKYLEYFKTKREQNHIFLIIAIIVLLFFISIDALYHWKYPYPVSSDLQIPFYFHYWQIGIVMIFIFGALRYFNTLKQITYWLFLCVFIEMGSYKLILEINSPSMADNGFTKWQTIRHAYDVTPHDFNPNRAQESDANISNSLFLLNNVWGGGAKNSLAYGSLPLDLCFPIHRVDMVSSALNELIKTRFRVPENASPQTYFALNKVKNDSEFMTSIGCNSQKLYITNSPFLTNSTLAEKNYLQETSDLYMRPTIRTNENNHLETNSNLSSNNKSTNIIEVTHFSANHVKLNVEINDEQNVFLVYLDSFHARWIASIDQKIVKIFPANIAFKSIELKPGRHEVIFTFLGGSSWTAITIWTNYVLCIMIFIFSVLNIMNRKNTNL